MSSIHFDHVKLYPKEQIQPHEHASWELSFIISGHGSRVVGDSCDSFDEGEIVLVPSALHHGWIFADEGKKIENITISFATSLLTNLLTTFPEFRPWLGALVSSEEAWVLSGETRAVVAELLHSMEDADESERCLIFQKILFEIGHGKRVALAGAGEAMSLSERRMKRVEVYVRCNYKRDISLALISGHVGMNRSAFCTWFKRTAGESFVNYLNRFRIEQAEYLLTLPERSVSQICYDCGFGDLPHFSRLFKKQVGLSPSTFRKMRLAE